MYTTNKRLSLLVWVFMPDIERRRKLLDLKNTWKDVLSETEKITKQEAFKGNKLVRLEIMASHSLGKFLKTNNREEVQKKNRTNSDLPMCPSL